MGAGCFFEPLGDERYRPTPHASGPWDPGAQHGGPPAALLGRAVEAASALPEGRTVRMSLDLLSPVPLRDLGVSARILRRGRRVEQVEAELADAGRTVMRATAWRIRTAELPELRPAPDVAALEPGPDGPSTSLDAQAEAAGWHGADAGYLAAMEWRFVEGSFLASGPAATWVRMRVPLVAGEEPTGLQRVLCAADSGNGISAELDLRTHLFINPDLTVVLARQPRGEWVGMRSRTALAGDGTGLARTELFDLDGPIGTGAQTLLVDRR